MSSIVPSNQQTVDSELPQKECAEDWADRGGICYYSDMKLSRYIAVPVLWLSCSVCSAATEGWTPAETNTWAWWDPSVASNMVTNASGHVSALYDRSGNSRTMTPNGTPTAGLRSIGGLNTIYCHEPDSEYLRKVTWTDFPASGNIAIFAVVDYDEGSGALVSWQNTWEFRPSSYQGGPYTNPAIFHFMRNWHTNATLPESFNRGYIDGVQRAADTAYTTKHRESYVGAKISLMSNWNPASTTGGALGEVVIIEDVADEARQMTEGYLAWKWGLVANLPSDHPYKGRAPGVPPAGAVLIVR